MTTYTVSVTREGRWWIVRVPEIDQVTQVRRLSEVTKAARELIAVTLDVPMSKVRVRVRVERVGAVEDVTGRAEAIRREHARADELARRAQDESKELARQLAGAHVPMRDIGELLGVSHQRVHQLISL
ncbi:MAG TPA: hypothetical protein VFC16_01245 [Nakamurella sp.]|nr:hypothetical protein [Nakamurella sp.]